MVHCVVSLHYGMTDSDNDYNSCATPCYRGICRSRVSLCLSVTSRCSAETAKRTITQTTPQRCTTPMHSRQNSTGSPQRRR